MDKKALGRNVWEKTKKGLSYGVGVGTGIVTTTICLAFAPQQAGRVAEIAFRVGTAGLSSATGFCAQQITEQELNLYEAKAIAFVKEHENQNKVKIKIVK